eukprot:7244733-Pyramimonas_sp.AAC.1
MTSSKRRHQKHDPIRTPWTIRSIAPEVYPKGTPCRADPHNSTEDPSAIRLSKSRANFDAMPFTRSDKNVQPK